MWIRGVVSRARPTSEVGGGLAGLVIFLQIRRAEPTGPAIL
jgi:hypothetical protein